MFTPLWLRSLTALRRWRQAVTCWGLGSARRRRPGAQPRLLGDRSRRRAAGRGDAGRAGGGGGGPALECSFLGPERLRTGVEDSSGWGFAPLPPPHPRAPFQALSGRFQNRAGKFKAQRGACAVGRGQWKKMKARNVSRAFLTRQTADTCGVSTDSFKDGVTVTRVLRRLLRCVTRDPARGEEKAYFLRWCVFKTGRRAVISWV